MEDLKYSTSRGRDVRFELLMARWEGCKIRNAQGLVEGTKEQKYSRLRGRVERLKIFKVGWK